MPPIENLIDELAACTINQVGHRPPPPVVGDALPGAEHIEFLATEVAVQLSNGGRLESREGTGSDNGRYLHFLDGTATAALLDEAHPRLISGSFSGCLFRVYAHEGQVYCMHIARSGSAPDAVTNEVNAYAAARGWRLCLEIPTAGMTGGNYKEVMIAAELSGNTVRAAVLKIDGNGGILLEGAARHAEL